MKTGVIIRSYRLTEYLSRVVRNYAWVDKIVIANYCFNRYEEHKDDTKDIIGGLGYNNIIYMGGGEPIAQSRVFELAQAQLLDCDVIFISDADEFLLPSDQARCIEILMGNDSLKKIECMVVDYSKKDATEAFAQRTHLPVVAFKPPVNFVGNRWCEGESVHLRDMFMHHFGYALDDYDWKLRNLWYSRHDADKITCTMKRKMNPPDALTHALTVSPAQ